MLNKNKKSLEEFGKELEAISGTENTEEKNKGGK